MLKDTFQLRVGDQVKQFGAFIRTEFLCITVLRVALGPRVKLAGRKCPSNPTVVYSSDRSKAVVLVLVLLLLLCGLFYEAICFKSYLVLFWNYVFSPFSIAITSLGEERANLSAFRTFVRFALVRFCLLPVPFGVWEGLRLVIVALLGLFSFLFFNGSKYLWLWKFVLDMSISNPWGSITG